MYYLSPAFLAWSNLNHSLTAFHLFYTQASHAGFLSVSHSCQASSCLRAFAHAHAAHYVWSTLFSSPDSYPLVLLIQLPKKTSQGFLHFSLETLPFSRLHPPNMTDIVSLS